MFCIDGHIKIKRTVKHTNYSNPPKLWHKPCVPIKHLTLLCEKKNHWQQLFITYTS